MSHFTTLAGNRRYSFKNGKTFLLCVRFMNFFSWAVVNFIKHTGIEAGPDLVANAVVNDVARHLPLLVTSGDGIPDTLCEGVINAVQTFGTLEENSVANETKELLPR